MMKNASRTERNCGGVRECRRDSIARVLALAGILGATTAAFGQSGTASGGASDTLEHCNKTLGVLRIQEDTSAPWYRYYGPRLGSSAPLLSMMILQSNCFVVVERGTGEASLNDETRRSRGDEARESGTRGKGQQVVAEVVDVHRRVHRERLEVHLEQVHDGIEGQVRPVGRGQVLLELRLGEPPPVVVAVQPEALAAHGRQRRLVLLRLGRRLLRRSIDFEAVDPFQRRDLVRRSERPRGARLEGRDRVR